MRFQEIGGAYDWIVSLGCSCEPAAHLRRNGLRTASSPLDWVVSQSLSQVNRMLYNRFSGYMELDHMEQMEGSADYVVDEEVQQEQRSYFILDRQYDVLSVHDFPIVPGEDWRVHYPAFKAKLDYRAERFLRKTAESRRALFVRWGGSQLEAQQLQEVLAGLTGGEFRILMLQGIKGLEVAVDNRWQLPGVASLSMPDSAGNHQIWDQILASVSLIT